MQQFPKPMAASDNISVAVFKTSGPIGREINADA
jgi:hypothetical protein